jgi:hypothetical protein
MTLAYGRFVASCQYAISFNIEDPTSLALQKVYHFLCKLQIYLQDDARQIKGEYCLFSVLPRAAHYTRINNNTKRYEWDCDLIYRALLQTAQ